MKSLILTLLVGTIFLVLIFIWVTNIQTYQESVKLSFR